MVSKTIIAALAAMLLWGCSLETIIDNEIRRRAPAAPGENPNPTPDQIITEPFEINSIQPNRGPTTGGTDIIVVGLGFTAEMQVTFGNTELTANQVEFINDNRVRFVAPPHDPGVVGIAVQRGQNRQLLEGAYTYFDPVALTSIEPTSGFVDGGQSITLHGAGFIPGTTVRFGSGGTPLNVILIDGETAVVVAPPLAQGTYSVVVSNINGSASLTGAESYRAVERVLLDEILPFAAPLQGSTELHAFGQGFVSPTTLSFAAHTFAAANNAQQNELTTLFEPDDSLVEGVLDAVAANTNGSHTLVGAFAVYDPTDTTPRIIGFWPDASRPTGGSTVRFVGVGFSGEPLVVLFGDEQASCSAIDDHQLECVAPPSNSGEGPVDIHVTTPEMDITLIGAFEYIEFTVDMVEPPTGSIAGGTWLQIFGQGFGGDTRVFVDGRPSPIIDVQDSTTVWAWTPRSPAPASVDVRVESRGITAVLSHGYTYLDPLNTAYFTHGGPTESAVNVTVVSALGGQPLADVFVMLASEHDPDVPYSAGFTDNRGQITLSGPSVSGPVDVHAAKVGFGGDSILAADAQNFTLALRPYPAPPPTPLPDCPEGEAPSFPPEGSPLVRGTVSRIKDEFNTGNDVVLVTTSFFNLSVPLPNPGQKNQMTSQGPYELFTRTGEILVVALAGTPTQNGFLDVHAMGFYPFLFTLPSSTQVCESVADCQVDEQCVDVEAQNKYCIQVYDDIDIVIDTPLNQPLRIEFENAPLGLEETASYAPPRRAYARVWYDFASMGVLPMGSTAALDADTLFVPMPHQMPAALSNSPFHVFGQISSVGSSGGSTWLEARAYNQLDTREPVILGPMLQAQQETNPGIGTSVVGQIGGEPIPLSIKRLPSDSTSPLPQYTQHIIYDVIEQAICLHPIFGPQQRMEIVYRWTALSPGNDDAMSLPLLPGAMESAALYPNGTFAWWMLGTYIADGANYHSLPRSAGQQWRSRTGRSTFFLTEP